MAGRARGGHHRDMDDNTATPSPAGAAPQPSSLDRFFAWLRTLDVRRDTDNKWIGGVCSGLARRFDVDPVLIRAAFVILFCLGFLGATLYLLLWVFLPETNGSIVAERAARQGDAWSIVLVVLLVLALVGGPSVAHDWNGGLWSWWVLVPIAAFAWFLTRRGKPGQQAVASGYAGSAAPQLPAAPVGGPDAPTGVSVAAAAGTEVTPDTPVGIPTSGSWTAPGAPSHGPSTPAYGPGTGGSAPLRPPPAPPVTPWPPAPPAPRRPRRPSAGFFGALLTLGVALLGYGVGYLLDGPTGFPGSRALLGLIVATAAAGVCLLVYGIIGRRAGLSALIAIVLALAAWATTVIPSAAITDGIGERTWYATTTSDTAYSLGIGDATLDLGGLDGYTGPQRHLKANVGIGQLTVVVPQGTTVRVHSTIGAGALDTNGDGDFEVKHEEYSRPGAGVGPGIERTTQVGSGPASVTVDAHVGLGDIVIQTVP